MKKSIQYLFIACIIQGILTSVIWFSSSRNNTAFSQEPFVPENALAATKIMIKDKEAETIIENTHGTWQLNNYRNLSAHTDKIEKLFSQLKALKKGWPIATSSAAATRFEVSDDNSQKTIVLFEGEKKVASIKLGTSPAHKKVHARLNDENEIYAVALSQHEVPANPDSWFDNNLLQTKGDITSATLTSSDNTKTQLTESEGIWRSSLTAGAETDQQAIKTWLGNFSALKVKSVVSSEEVEKITVQSPTLTVNLTLQDSTVDYAFYQYNDKFFVKHYGDKKVFEISSYEATPIIDVDPQQFVAKPAPEVKQE